jgi:hypothetical protein
VFSFGTPAAPAGEGRPKDEAFVDGLVERAAALPPPHLDGLTVEAAAAVEDALPAAPEGEPPPPALRLSASFSESAEKGKAGPDLSTR